MDEELQQPVEADESQGLSAGFAKARGEEPPAEVQPAEEKAEVTETVEPQTTPEPEPDPIEKFKGETTKNIEKIYGKFGEIQRTLQQLQARPASPTVDNTAAVEKMKEEFPELAELLIPVIAGRTVPGTNVDEVVNQRVSEVMTQKEIAIEQRFLRKDHPDAREVINSEQFVNWLRQQPAPYQQEVSTTKDSEVLSQGLSEFKQWRDAQNKAANAASESHRRKQARLEGAITPTGVPVARQSKLPDEAGLTAGFNKVRKLTTTERIK